MRRHQETRNRQYLRDALEGSAAAAAKATTTEATSTKAAATPTRTGATGARRRNERLMSVRCHGMHGSGEEDGIERHIRRGSDVPVGRVLRHSLEGFGPAILNAQRHGVGQNLLEGVGRHAFQAI